MAMAHHLQIGLLSKTPIRGQVNSLCVLEKVVTVACEQRTPSVHLAVMAPFHSPDMVTKGFLSGCKISALTRFFLPP